MLEPLPNSWRAESWAASSSGATALGGEAARRDLSRNLGFGRAQLHLTVLEPVVLKEALVDHHEASLGVEHGEAVRHVLEGGRQVGPRRLHFRVAGLDGRLLLAQDAVRPTHDEE